MFEKKYKMDPSPVPAIEWKDYEKIVTSEYNALLDHSGDNESAFQHFFEKVPSFVPGPFELFGESGHFPYLNSLISQPEIGGGCRRYPDFLWLAQDSLNFCPVFIEIEKPCKKAFTKAGIQSAELTQALDQINEWKMLLHNPTNIQLLYDYFSIPDYMREKKFSPQFALIFGRRCEYEGDKFLTQKRAELAHKDVCLMSFDRLRPKYEYRELLCSKIERTKYRLLSIPDTYMFSPNTADVLERLNGFIDAVDKMENTSPERKEFLKRRFSYWREFGSRDEKGTIHPSDEE